MTERFDFSDLRDLFAKANEEKSGDQLAGIAARSERERIAAKRKLADLTLEEVIRRPLIDPSEDDVTRLLLDMFDREAFRSHRKYDRRRVSRVSPGRRNHRGSDTATAEGHHSGNRRRSDQADEQ